MPRLSYELRGDVTVGVPLVLLHAFPLDRRMWEKVVPRLRGSGVVLVDLPGAGESPMPEQPSLVASADGVLAVLDALDLHRVVVAGVSMGGYVALQLARTAPERLAGLALIDTKAEADTEPARAKRLEMAAAVEHGAGSVVLEPMVATLLGETTRASRPDVVADLRERLAAAPPWGVAWSQRAMAARGDSSDVLAALRVPVTVVVGAEDAATPPEAARAIADLAPDATLVVLPGSGHLTPLEAPDAVAAALVDLLARVSG